MRAQGRVSNLLQGTFRRQLEHRYGGNESSVPASSLPRTANSDLDWLGRRERVAAVLQSPGTVQRLERIFSPLAAARGRAAATQLHGDNTPRQRPAPSVLPPSAPAGVSGTAHALAQEEQPQGLAAHVRRHQQSNDQGVGTGGVYGGWPGVRHCSCSLARSLSSLCRALRGQSEALFPSGVKAERPLYQMH